MVIVVFLITCERCENEKSVLPQRLFTAAKVSSADRRKSSLPATPTGPAIIKSWPEPP